MNQTRRSRWATVRMHAGTVVAVATVGFAGISFAVVPSDGATGWLLVWHVVSAFAALGSSTAMVWRVSHTQAVAVAVSGGSILLSLDPIGPALALRWIVADADRRTMWWAVPLTSAAIVVPLLRDAARPIERTLLTAQDAATGELTQLSWLGSVLVAAAIIAIAAGSGLVRRSRAATAHAQQQVRERDLEADRLLAELSRQEERELIAREMHDTVAHHLSLVSLHAAALEVTSDDPVVPESARAVRASAHDALEEMRSLITSLRDSGSGGYAGSPPTLADLKGLVEQTRQAGAWIAASLQVPPDSEPPGAVTRAVYRIVQESLTNAMRHAPGSSVGLQVVAAPGAGVTAAIATWLPHQDGVEAGTASGSGAGNLQRVGAGTGIIGMTERATAVGGRLSAGAEGGLWVVRAWLPWEES